MKKRAGSNPANCASCRPHQDVAIIDDSGQLVAKRRITDDPSGFAELIEILTAAGDCAEDPVPVAIETPRGLLVASLRATGRPVYAITHWR